MTENKRFKIRRNALGMKFICYDDNLILIGTYADNDGLKEVGKLLNEQEENLQLLIAKTRCINKQRHNLVNFLKGTGHSLEEIKKIMNGDVND